eukprot:TRINITY_DN7767_c0_g2_i1.p1 TRINITY_DN7767_c0_g2~~TRINITY_DN7767_c0_g2_i1.p1  ORF type:complete len:181 (-),score=40.39 TRINITY_DN7767_c0_g2_i1:385-927(-)
MRPLTEEETKKMFEKLVKFIGPNIRQLIDRTDEDYCFRLHKDRVYYVSERVMKKATNIARDNLVALGVLVGKFTKGKNFHLQVTCLELIAQYAEYKVWVKPSAELSFLYGNHILKAGLHRMSQNTPTNQGVVVFSQSDLPLGFGVTARSSLDSNRADPTSIIVLHQADIGEYLRTEDHIG